MNKNSLIFFITIVFTLFFKIENSIAKSNGCMDAKRVEKIKEIEASFIKLSIKNEIINISETLYKIYSSSKIYEDTFDVFFSNIDLEKQNCGIEITKCNENDEQCKFVQSFSAMENNPIRKDLPKAIRYLKIAENIEAKKIQSINIPETYDAKKTLLEKFNAKYPIKGGWGYSIEDSVIFDREGLESDFIDPIWKNFVSFEYTFIEHRLHLELNTFRSDTDYHLDIKLNGCKQSTIGNNERIFDYLECNVMALPLQDFNRLKAEYEMLSQMASGIEKEQKLKDNIEKLKNSYVTGTSIFWFDITKPYKDTYKK